MSALVSIQTNNGVLSVPFDVIQMSGIIKQMMDDWQITEENAAQMPIPIKDINEEVLAKIIEWCTHHKDGNSKDLEGPICPRYVDDEVIAEWVENNRIQEWDAKFLDAMNNAFILQLLKDSSFLHVKGLVELTALKIAGMLNGKSEEELVTEFGLPNDQTEEGIKALNDEIAWLLMPQAAQP